MNTITTRFALMMAAAAVVPLLAFGAVSVLSVGTGARQAVIEGNQDVARRVGEQLEQYVIRHVRILNAVAADMRFTGLQPWQQERILRNFVLQFPEFIELTLLDEEGRPVVTSRVDEPTTELPGAGSRTLQDALISPFGFDDDLLPTAVAAVRLPLGSGADAWLVGRLHLEELWRMVDGIRVGSSGYALIITDEGTLLAHGDASMVARRENLAGHPVVTELRHEHGADHVVAAQYAANGIDVLGVGARLPNLGWTVVVEQPIEEAFAIPTRLQRQLVVSIAVALLVMLALGGLWGRRFLQPILRLTRGTRALADGRLDTRVAVDSSDEIGQLGAAFNTMADRLVQLQDDVRRKERHAMFGRIALGLVHDLQNPIQNMGNGCKFILQNWDDHEYRETFGRRVQHDLAHIKRVLDDLRNIANPMPVTRVPLDVNRSVAALVDSMTTSAQNAGVTLATELADAELFIDGDVYALERVYRNLITNALQATPPRGRVRVRTAREAGLVVVDIADTGCGIPPERLQSIFDDFATTKRRGLGLGLAVSRKIVEQLGGTLSVESEVGNGSTFTMRFPITDARPEQAAAG